MVVPFEESDHSCRISDLQAQSRSHKWCSLVFLLVLVRSAVISILSFPKLVSGVFPLFFLATKSFASLIDLFKETELVSLFSLWFSGLPSS